MRSVSTHKSALLRAVATLSLLLVLSSMAISPARAQGNDCAVSEGVVQNGNTITGTSGNDTIDCTNSTSGKIMTGGDGNDTITGGLGADYIDGGSGNDTITGGPANDCIWGWGGDDTLTGSEGSNTIYPGDGNNSVSNNDDPEGTITGCMADGSVTVPSTSTAVPSVTTTAPAETATAAPSETSTVVPDVTSTVAPGVTSTVAPGVTSTVAPGVTSTVAPDSGPTLVSVTLATPSVTGGDSTTATVTLSAPALSGGVTVLVASGNPSAGVAESVFVLEGDTTAVFEIGTSSVPATTYVTITATLGGANASVELEMRPGAVSVAPIQGVADADVTVPTQARAVNETSAAAVVTSLPSTGTNGRAEQGSATLVMVAGTISLAAFAIQHAWAVRRTS